MPLYLIFFSLVSKVILRLLWFCIASLCDWLKNLAPLSQPIRSKTKTNRGIFPTRFPVLGAGYMHLLWVLIGSLDCLHLLWLTRVVTWVLILCHSTEKYSISHCTCRTILLWMANLAIMWASNKWPWYLVDGSWKYILTQLNKRT